MSQAPMKLSDQVAVYSQSKMAEIVAFAGGQEKAAKFIADMKMLCIEPTLAPCQPVTIFMSSLNALQLGLSIVKQQGQAYVLPWNNKGQKQAQLQIGYKGWILICRRGGYEIDCELVYDCDTFSYTMDETGKRITFSPSIDEHKDNEKWVRENLKGAIVWVTGQDGKTKANFVPALKLAKLRAKSQAPNSPAWTGWTEEMYKAKAIKYVASKLPSDNELVMNAVGIDSEADRTVIDVESAVERDMITAADLNAEMNPAPATIDCPDKGQVPAETCNTCPQQDGCPQA